MTLEADVAERLRAAADELLVGEPPVSKMARRARRRSQLKVAGIVVGVVALLGVAGTVGQLVLVSKQDLPAAAFAPTLGRETREWSSDAFRDTPALVQEADRERALSAAPGEPREAPDVPDQLGVGPRVIKTAEVALEVPDGRFQDAFSDAQEVAGRYGGFVTASATSGERARSGEVTLRVPAERFEEALQDLHELGRVRSEQVQGQDVTSEFVDLEARLRHWLAQERVLLRLMNRATTISETLNVQRRLEDVQLEIERIRGQLRVLRDQTALATITVAVHEKGVAPGPPPGPGKLAGAWDRALTGALDVLAAIIVGLGYLLPIALVVALMWFGVRTVRARTAS